MVVTRRLSDPVCTMPVSPGTRYAGWTPVGVEMGRITCFLRDGDRVFLTYRTTGRGNEPAAGVFGLLDMTPYGRGEAWQDMPDGWPEGRDSCWYRAIDAAVRTSR